MEPISLFFRLSNLVLHAPRCARCPLSPVPWLLSTVALDRHSTTGARADEPQALRRSREEAPPVDQRLSRKN